MKDHSANLDKFDLEAIREGTAIQNSFKPQKPKPKRRLSSDPQAKARRAKWVTTK
jgi:hypothetical protein